MRAVPTGQTSPRPYSAITYTTTPEKALATMLPLRIPGERCVSGCAPRPSALPPHRFNVNDELRTDTTAPSRSRSAVTPPGVRTLQAPSGCSARGVETVWPRTIVQTCVVHLLRNSFRYAARQDWDKIAELLKPVYTAPTEEAALERFAEFADAWGRKYAAIVKLWENTWGEFTPFLRSDTEIRRIVCATNAIESVNARIRRAVKARGHFPSEQAALKCVYMAIMSLDPTGRGAARWTMRWKTALNAFDIAFDGRLSAARQ